MIFMMCCEMKRELESEAKKEDERIFLVEAVRALIVGTRKIKAYDGKKRMSHGKGGQRGRLRELI